MLLIEPKLPHIDLCRLLLDSYQPWLDSDLPWLEPVPPYPGAKLPFLNPDQLLLDQCLLLKPELWPTGSWLPYPVPSRLLLDPPRLRIEL